MDRHRLATVGMCAVLLVLAGGLRFYRLGAAPFHVDELATQAEVDVLMRGFRDADDTQISRLPRLIPLSHLVHALGYQCFGTDEFGSRVMMAILGTLSPLLIFLGLPASLGRAQSFIAALLVALWPEHIYYSQDNRFYITSHLVASLCMVAGAQAIARRSLPWAIGTGVLGVAAVFTHIVLILLLAGFLAAVLVTACVARDRALLPTLGVGVVCALVVAAIFLGYQRPVLGQWNAGPLITYTSLRGLGNSLFHLGWPIAVLAGFGSVLALMHRDEQDCYWLVWASFWAGSAVIMPYLVPYTPNYNFPLAFGFIILAAKGIHRVYHALMPQSRVAAIAWVALACLLNFPSLVSHYVDGSCSNYREAAHCVRSRMQPSDALFAAAVDLMQYYLPEGPTPEAMPPYAPERAIASLRQRLDTYDRVWVVFSYGRATPPHALLQWLRANGTHELGWCLTRFDSFQYTTDVFLLTRRR